jgi:hypothetical protein
MLVRSALEQDAIDFMQSVQEIYEKQLELHKSLRELFDAIAAKYALQENTEELNLTKFGVNQNRFSLTSTEAVKISRQFQSDPSV